MICGANRARVPVAILVMAVLAAGCHARKEQEPATLVVTSVPEGVDVRLSGRNLGTTPLSADDIAPGNYVVTMKKDGYESTSLMVDLEAGETEALDITLQRETTIVEVESTPSQARFFHEDGSLIGVTPYHGYVPTGQYRMRFSKENYEDEFVHVNIKRSSSAYVVAKLRPMKTRITITSDPRQARIYIDEIERGRKTPATIIVEPGFRTVGVALEGYSREERDINVEPNADIEVHFDLVPGNVPAGMAKVTGSEFIMGSDTESVDERPRRKVYLDTFFIDKFEVTNARYQRFKPTHTFPLEIANHPVVNITWHEAKEYAEWAGKRLPTEMEWEKAARGEGGNTYPWGNAFDKSFCNVKGELSSLLKAVGKFPEGRSPFGCYDMAGNVWEWVADDYGPYPGNTEMRNIYGQQYRVIRGGGYDESAFHARCSNRDYERPNVGRPDLGFRCAMSPEDSRPEKVGER